ncbi:MAG: SPASM domain-containing protein [Myxococcales bacterium]|nr:SPASM domain-containing protein [Myxococcales bacterium]
MSLSGVTEASCDRHAGMPRYARVLEGLRELARHGSTALLDLMLFPEDVDEVATELPALRGALPAGTRISFGLAYHSGREVGDHVFRSRGALEAAFDKIVLEAGEEIAATPRSPLTERREGCACALGQSLNVRSDGELFSCFRMEESVSNLRRSSFERTLSALREDPRPASRQEPCRSCALVSLCGGGCRSENLLFTGDADRPVCGPWRIEVLSELLAEDHVSSLEWPAVQLASEARARGIAAPELGRTVQLSRHTRDV